MLLSRLPDGRPEIFTSIQGEGITCGLASIFVRLSLCNLACSFCDTKYTWDWDRYDRDIETIELAAEDVVRDVLTRARRGPKNVVITGGEPLLQQRDLVDVAQRLHDAGLGIEVETNGTITPADALAACVDQWNVSPKLASSGNAAAARERAETIAWFAARTSAYFKFVIVDPPDVDEAAAFAERYEIAPAQIILMPEGVAPRVLAERSRWLSERCQQTGARLGMRLHVLLWGAERGR